MKNLKILSLILVLSLIGVTVAGCSKKTVAPTTTTQDITVGKGNITLSITSTGTMDYANYQNLSFATDGNVGAVNVKVGDIVKKDQVLATLDPTAWNNSLTNLTQAVQTAQRNLTTVQSNLAKSQRAVTTAQLTVSQDALTAQNDQNVVQKDQNTLQKDQDALANISTVQTAQNAVDAAQSELDAAQSNWQITSAQGDAATADLLFKLINGDPSIKDSFGVYIPNGLKVQLAQAQKNLKSIENGTSTAVTSDVALQVATAQVQISVDQLQILKDQWQILKDQNTAIGDQAAIDDANTAVANAQQDVTNAQTTLTTAQTNLTTAQAASTQITAPFDGAITAVNIQAGVGLSVSSSGAIKAGATAIVIADTSKFVANMMVNETDLPSISIGTTATVTASAIPNVTLSAVVKTISPIATTQSGVVNYAVTATILGVAPQARTTTTGTSGTTTPSTSGQSGTAITPTTSGQTGPLAFNPHPGNSDQMEPHPLIYLPALPDKRII
jgi:HlyD family secretion protein